MEKVKEDLLYKIKTVKNYDELFNIAFENNDKSLFINYKKLKVALFVNTCYGFGDIIFTLKIQNYIKQWYNVDCSIITTNPKKFIGRTKSLYCTKIPHIKKYTECIDTKGMRIYNIDENGNSTTLAKLPNFDLIFATPWIGTDFDPNRNLLKSIFPYTNKFNTFLFSEYNLPDYKKYDFPVGIGKNYCGILLSNNPIYFKEIQKTPRLIENPYIIVHISEHPYVNINKCFSNFIKLMCKKYHNNIRNLDIICPSILFKNTKEFDKLKSYIVENGYYDNVIKVKNSVDKGSSEYSGSTLTFNSSILPLEYEKFQSLFYYSLPDILVTGDQSLTDIINSPKDFNLYYQTMPWKTGLAKTLSKILHTDYLKNVGSSCGLENLSLNDKTDLKLISENYSFEKLGKPKMDRIFKNAILFNTDKVFKTFQSVVLSSRKKNTVYKKLSLL